MNIWNLHTSFFFKKKEKVLKIYTISSSKYIYINIRRHADSYSIIFSLRRKKRCIIMRKISRLFRIKWRQIEIHSKEFLEMHYSIFYWPESIKKKCIDAHCVFSPFFFYWFNHYAICSRPGHKVPNRFTHSHTPKMIFLPFFFSPQFSLLFRNASA